MEASAGWVKHVEVHHYHHFDPITVSVDATVEQPITVQINVTEIPPPPPPKPTATRATLTIGGTAMPGQITVDTTNETATLAFADDHGNATDTPAGASVTFSSDNPAVATIDADPSNPLVGNITPVSIGSANISAAIAGALEADGVTPIPDPAPVVVTVSAGPAADASLVLSA